MISNREAIHGRPQPPARPFPNMRMYLSGENDACEITKLRGNDGSPTKFRSIAEVCEAEDHNEGE